MTTTSPIRLAAAAMPIRQADGGSIEVLMVRRNPDLSFGGMWTFPGGVIEEGDGPVPSPLDEDTQRWEEPSLVATAANAAAREAQEETALEAAAGAMTWFSHWIPPKLGVPKRFATWFFLAPEHSGEIVVDQAENDKAMWVTATNALQQNAEGSFPLAIPTWITLDDLGQATDIASLVDTTAAQGPSWYHTHALGPVGRKELEQRALCWPGDAGYESGDPERPGARNRVVADSRFAIVERIRER